MKDMADFDVGQNVSYSQYKEVLPLVQKICKADYNLNTSVDVWPTRYESPLEQ